MHTDVPTSLMAGRAGWEVCSSTFAGLLEAAAALPGSQPARNEARGWSFSAFRGSFEWEFGQEVDMAGAWVLADWHQIGGQRPHAAAFFSFCFCTHGLGLACSGLQGAVFQVQCSWGGAEQKVTELKKQTQYFLPLTFLRVFPENHSRMIWVLGKWFYAYKILQEYNIHTDTYIIYLYLYIYI